VTQYNADFYAAREAGSASSAGAIVPLLIDTLRPSTVMDVGCGSGEWLAQFARSGVHDLVGVDGPWAKPAEEGLYRFVAADLSQPFRISETFDLAISLEVAEHLPQSSASAFIGGLTALAPVIVFSAAIPHQGGTQHVNEQWPEYWAQLFGHHDFVPVDFVRPLVWSIGSIDWWYAQNTLLYVQEQHLRLLPQLHEAWQRTDPSRLGIVHPAAYLEKCRRIADAEVGPDGRRLPVRTLVKVTAQVFRHAIRRRLRPRSTS
jgi:SAM-dependent methyltransferase